MNLNPLFAWMDPVSRQALPAPDPASGAGADTPLGVLFAGDRSELKMLGLRSMAFGLKNPYLLANVRLYLEAEAATETLLLDVWPAQKAGVSLSFDRGITWTLLTRQAGNPGDPSTWLLLPGPAVSQVQADGRIGPDDTAILLLRVDAPATAGRGLIRFSLGVDADIW